MAHHEQSVQGKLDHIIFILEDATVGVCPRVAKMEQTINGNGKAGLAEKVRNLQSENMRQTAIISTGISGVIIGAWTYARHKLGW